MVDTVVVDDRQPETDNAGAEEQGKELGLEHLSSSDGAKLVPADAELDDESAPKKMESDPGSAKEGFNGGDEAGVYWGRPARSIVCCSCKQETNKQGEQCEHKCFACRQDVHGRLDSSSTDNPCSYPATGQNNTSRMCQSCYTLNADHVAATLICSLAGSIPPTTASTTLNGCWKPENKAGEVQKPSTNDCGVYVCTYLIGLTRGDADSIISQAGELDRYRIALTVFDGDSSRWDDPDTRTISAADTNLVLSLRTEKGPHENSRLKPMDYKSLAPKMQINVHIMEDFIDTLSKRSHADVLVFHGFFYEKLREDIDKQRILEYPEAWSVVCGATKRNLADFLQIGFLIHHGGNHWYLVVHDRTKSDGVFGTKESFYVVDSAFAESQPYHKLAIQDISRFLCWYAHKDLGELTRSQPVFRHLSTKFWARLAPAVPPENEAIDQKQFRTTVSTFDALLSLLAPPAVLDGIDHVPTLRSSHTTPLHNRCGRSTAKTKSALVSLVKIP